MACVNSTRGISVSTIWPCSPADSTTSRPLPSSRSSGPLENDTSLILASGMSRPRLVTMPSRTRKRRVVSSYVVVRQRSTGTISHSIRARIATAATASRSAAAAEPDGISASATSATAITSTATSSGRTSVFQCG